VLQHGGFFFHSKTLVDTVLQLSVGRDRLQLTEPAVRWPLTESVHVHRNGKR
jgi:hypothetical protein